MPTSPNMPPASSAVSGWQRWGKSPPVWPTGAAPLNVVQTSLYYLDKVRTPSPEKWAEHMRRIDAVSHANDVVTTLSNFARMPVPELQPYAVELCVREALDDSVLPSGIQVTLDFPTDLPAVLADAGQIRIVLGNLIRNAIDAMPSGGHLTLTGWHESNEWRPWPWLTPALASVLTNWGGSWSHSIQPKLADSAWDWPFRE